MFKLHHIKKPWQPLDSGRFTLQRFKMFLVSEIHSFGKSYYYSARTAKCNIHPAQHLGSCIHKVLNRALAPVSLRTAGARCTFCPTVPNGWTVISFSKAGRDQAKRCLKSRWLSTKSLPLPRVLLNVKCALAHTCKQTEAAEAVNNTTFWHPSLKSATLT